MAAPQEKCRVCSSSVNLFKPLLGFLVLFLATPTHAVDTGSLLKLVSAAVNNEKLGNDVGLMWGIPDSTAYVGHLFNYSIPAEAFKGQGITYTVREAGKNKLPDWLAFDSNKKVLKGVPVSSEIGQHYIEVIATGKNGAQAKDIFSIEVQGERSNQASATLTYEREGPKPVRCKREQPETVVTIVVDSDIEQLIGTERLSLMDSFSQYLNLAHEMLKVIPVGGKSLKDASALVAGPGNIKEPKKSGVFVSWRVGCGKVEADHMPILQQIESEAKDGKLAKALKHDIVAWHVTNSRFQEHKRRRRAIRATPVPTPGILPTIPQQPPKETIIMTKPGGEMTHPVFSMASPTFTIQPTETKDMMKTVSPDGKPLIPTRPTHVKPTGGLEPSAPVPEPTDMDKTVPLPEETIHVQPTKTRTDGEPTDTPAIGCIPSQPPRVRKPIGRVPMSAGSLTKFRIPTDTFEDCEAGNTRGLNLTLYHDQDQEIPKNYWLSFERSKQLIKAFPMGEDIGVHSFTLVALKGSDGLMQTHNFKIKVMGMKSKDQNKVNHEVTVTLDMDYDEFMSNFDNRVMFVNKLSRVFGDSNANSIQLRKIERGSVVISWTNSSLSGSDCPVNELKGMADRLMNEDGTVREEAARALKPFKLASAGLAPKGSCENVDAFPDLASPPVDPSVPKEPTDKKPEEPESTTQSPSETTTEGVRTGQAGGGDNDIWITTVVPAVVIVAILLIALLVACILYRKKRKGKMSLEDKHTFVNKGVPVILPDELEENEKNGESCKPLIMPEEKPPVTSPEYRAGSSEASTPPANHRNMFPEDDTITCTSPLYQPPHPPQSASGNRQPRPHMQPYNKPTAYVPP